MNFKFNWWPFNRKSKTNALVLDEKPGNNLPIEFQINEVATTEAPEIEQPQKSERDRLSEEYGEESIIAAEAYLARQNNVRNTTSYLRAILKNNWHQEELNQLHASRAKSYWQEFKRLPIEDQKKHFTELQLLIKQKSAEISADLGRYSEQILHPSRVIIKDSGSPQYQSYLFWCWSHHPNLFKDQESVEYKFFELFKILKPMPQPVVASHATSNHTTIRQPYFNAQAADQKFVTLHKFAKFKLYNQIKAQVTESSEIIQRLPNELQHQSTVILAGNSKPYAVAYLFWLYLNQTSFDYASRKDKNLAMFALFEVLKHRNKPTILNIHKNGDIFIGTHALKWRYEK